MWFTTISVTMKGVEELDQAALHLNIIHKASYISFYALALTAVDGSGAKDAEAGSPAMDSVFAFKAAKYVFIALAVNCSPVTAGYFFFGPWITASLQGWLKNAMLYLSP
jgi:hypothetical protein